MAPIVVFNAFESNPFLPGGIADAYDAATNGYYIVGKNAVHQAFFDKLINNHYALSA